MRSKLYINILGKNVIRLLLLSLIVGGLLFATEYLFAFSLQVFLSDIGLSVPKPKNALFDYFPKSNGLIIFVVIGTLRAILMGIKNYLIGASNQSFLAHQRRIILQHSLTQAASTSSHQVSSLFSDTLNRAASCVLDFTVILTTGTTTALLLIAGFNLAPKEMAIGILLISTVLIPTKILNLKIKNAGINLTNSWDNINKRINEGIKYNYFFLAHGFIQRMINDGNKEIHDYETSYKEFFIFSAIKNNIPNLFGILIVVFIVFISKNYIQTDPSTLLAFIYMFFRASQGGSELLVALNSFLFNRFGLEKIVEFNQQIIPNNFKEDNSVTNSQFDKVQQLEFNNVNFSYDSQKIINNLNFKINVDEPLIIKGESGVGKSTLLSLILGANKPNIGDITLNDKSIYSSIADFRKKLAYVGPEPYIFNDTIRNNLLLSTTSKNISENKIHAILKDLEIDQFINQFPDGLDHVFNEHANISTGQKQRLSIARALLRNPEILILDEATANIDPDIEFRILNNLKKHLHNKMLIIVSHKNSFDILRKKELIVFKDETKENKWKLNVY